MITLNTFNIQNDNQELHVSVTTSNSTITSVKLWNSVTFQDPALSTNLNYKLEQTSNTETFVVLASELNLQTFNDLYFIEVTDNEGEKILAVTYNFSKFNKCLLNAFYEDFNTICLTCDSSFINDKVLTIGLSLELLEKALNEGYITQSLSIYNSLIKLCSLQSCDDCSNVKCNTCSNFKQF